MDRNAWTSGQLDECCTNFSGTNLPTGMWKLLRQDCMEMTHQLQPLPGRSAMLCMRLERQPPKCASLNVHQFCGLIMFRSCF